MSTCDCISTDDEQDEYVYKSLKQIEEEEEFDGIFPVSYFSFVKQGIQQAAKRRLKYSLEVSSCKSSLNLKYIRNEIIHTRICVTSMFSIQIHQPN